MHPRDFTLDIVEAIDSESLCDHVHLPGAVAVVARAEADAARVHTRAVHGAGVADEGCEAPDQHDEDIIGLIGQTPSDSNRPWTCWPKCSTARRFSCFQTCEAEHSGADHAGFDSGNEKSLRLQGAADLQRETQRANYAKHIGEELEAMVEGYNTARGQIIGSYSAKQNREFHDQEAILPAQGFYSWNGSHKAFPTAWLERWSRGKRWKWR